MAAANTPAHDDLLALIAQVLCTRKLSLFAQESRLDGESLKDAVERYEVDYAWHVLGSARLRDETAARLEAKLGEPATEAQKACVAEVLKAAGMSQPSDALMSFDNDVAEQLAAMLSAQSVIQVTPQVEAVS